MKLWLLPLLALSLIACSQDSGDKLFDNYQQRLARVLNTDIAQQPVPAYAALAEPRDLKQSLPDLRLDLTDTLATRHCGLDTLIGERNSSLGRVYSASKQLSYELRFLNQLQHCLAQSWDDTALLAQLQQVYQHKQNSVHVAFNNMLLTDDTLRKELLGARSSLPLTDVSGQSETWHFEFRIWRQWHARPLGGRVVQATNRHGDHPCALQPVWPGHWGPDRRPHQLHVFDGFGRHPANSRRQTQGHGRHGSQTLACSERGTHHGRARFW